MLPLLEPPARREEVAWGLVVVLAMTLYVTVLKLKVADAALAARPTVHMDAEQKVQVVRVAGPVRVEEKIVYKPGTKEIQYVDRIMDRAPVTTTTQKESEVKKDVVPACPAGLHPTRYAGLTLGPDGWAGSWVKGARGGITVYDTWDLGATMQRDLSGSPSFGVDVSFRW